MAAPGKSLIRYGKRAEPVTVFRGRRLPVPAYLVGYSALMEAFELRVPLHHQLAAVSPKNTRRKEDGWIIYPNSMLPSSTVVDNLVFALKHEGVQFLPLKKLFTQFDRRELEQAAQAKPTSAYIRRLCFFYEFLIEKSLEVLTPWLALMWKQLILGCNTREHRQVLKDDLE